MKVTFINDHIFYKYKKNYYTSGSLNPDVIKRYTTVFSKIHFVTRQKKTKFKTASLPVNNCTTSFTKVPHYKSLRTVKNYALTKRIIKDEVEKADFLILRSGTFANIAAKYARKIKKPYLIEVVGCSWDAHWNYGFLGKFIAPFAYLGQKRAVKHADFAVYVTNSFLQKRYPTNGKETNCSNVSLKQFDSTVIKKRIEKIKNKTTLTVIGTTAAIDVKYKGQQYIIRALSKLKKAGKTNFEYQLVGNGDSDYLKSVAEKYGVSEQVKFLGSLSHNEVFEWLKEIDIYAQPSRQEGLPRAVIEAMSCALPAIGAKTAGIPELLDDEFIFSNSSKNIDEICELLLSLDAQTMIEQAKRNYNEAKKYDKEIIEKRREHFLKKFKKSV